MNVETLSRPRGLVYDSEIELVRRSTALLPELTRPGWASSLSEQDREAATREALSLEQPSEHRDIATERYSGPLCPKVVGHGAGEWRVTEALPGGGYSETTVIKFRKPCDSWKCEVCGPRKRARMAQRSERVPGWAEGAWVASVPEDRWNTTKQALRRAGATVHQIPVDGKVYKDGDRTVTEGNPRRLVLSSTQTLPGATWVPPDELPGVLTSALDRRVAGDERKTRGAVMAGYAKRTRNPNVKWEYVGKAPNKTPADALEAAELAGLPMEVVARDENTGQPTVLVSTIKHTDPRWVKWHLLMAFLPARKEPRTPKALEALIHRRWEKAA